MGSQHQTTLDYNSTMTSEIHAMSVYEDDMEVDAPSLRDNVIFSSDNTNSKGKRSAANLPVEAEDSLPW
jgi:hypothetical protein